MEKLLRNFVKASAKLYYNTILNKKRNFKYIPASGKLLGFEEMANMIDATLDMWLTAGRFNDTFETEFAKYLGVKYALTTNSGSSANLLAISALTSHKLGERRLKKGDEVITVAPRLLILLFKTAWCLCLWIVKSILIILMLQK